MIISMYSKVLDNLRYDKNLLSINRRDLLIKRIWKSSREFEKHLRQIPHLLMKQFPLRSETWVGSQLLPLPHNIAWQILTSTVNQIQNIKTEKNVYCYMTA